MTPSAARPRSQVLLAPIGMVAGAGGALVSDLPDTASGRGFGGVGPMYAVPIALVAGVLVVALMLVVITLTVHGIESLLDRNRSIASLAAVGIRLTSSVR